MIAPIAPVAIALKIPVLILISKALKAQLITHKVIP